MTEKWREVYTQEQIKKIQEIELKNLKVLKAVCEELGIDFFLYGGSLIGAVRHRGFVPWDDDLDVAMLREDYMKFVKEAPALLPNDYYLQTPYTDKKTPYFYSKLRLKGTKCIDFAYHKLDIEKGIYVDIYPIDNMPDDDAELMDNFKQYQKMIRIYVWRQSPYSSMEGGERNIKRLIKNGVKYMVFALLHLIPHRFLVNQIDRIMTRDNHRQTKRKGNYSYPEPKNLFLNITPFEDGVFEGIPVKLPRNWDFHLTSRYGDYMKMPPENERLGHRPFELDFGDYEFRGEEEINDVVI